MEIRLHTRALPTSGRPSERPGDDERADVAACRESLRNGSKTFLAASLLLPARVRGPATVLYAFCRLADDAVDVDGGHADAVDRLRERLARVYEQRPAPHPADRALVGVVGRHGIPREVIDALLDGLAWDAQGRTYETIESLCDYAARVAGTVGAMMALVMGVRDDAAVARACELGVAMQFSNIARDVGEDARAGRLYLPRRWMREAGVDPERFLAAPAFSAELGAVVSRLLLAANDLYRRVDDGVARLPLSCRPGINAARSMYEDIGLEVARRGLDSIASRAVVPASRKARLLAESFVRLWPARAQPPLAVLPAIVFLVDAVRAAPAPALPAVPDPEPWGPMRRLVGTVELFERLERRDREALRG